MLDGKSFNTHFNYTKSLLRNLDKMTDENKSKVLDLLNSIEKSEEKSDKTIIEEIVTIPRPKFEITKLKKYDVCYGIFGSSPRTGPHYCVVIGIDKDRVYYLNLTSNRTSYARHLITKNRNFKDKYLASILGVGNYSDFINSFCFHYGEGKSELKVHVDEILNEYKYLFK